MGEWLNPWLVFSLIFLGIWLAVWLTMPKARREMLWASILTAPFGLTEPIFVPAYWNPPSLFNLAATTGFDIESLIFSFAIGGIGSVLYEAFAKGRHVKLNRPEKSSPHHRFHVWALISPVFVFLPLYLFTPINPIYSASLAMLAGAFAGILCRPDLKRKITTGAFLFLALYFAFFFTFNLAYPGFIEKVWNLPAISGILVLGVPFEELMFAFTFGALWSSYYEHIGWHAYKEKKRR